MAHDDTTNPDESVDPVAALTRQEGQELSEEDRRVLEEVADNLDQPGLQDQILARYSAMGRELLGDTQPKALDPRIIAGLEPLLGDVSGVRVHTGKLATEAARVMDARAFALGDRDIFIDQAEYDVGSSQGRALIAHEVAHTVDAATGFALSARGGEDHSHREAFADETAARFQAQESRPEGEQASVGGPSQPPAFPKIPKHKLARMIVDVLDKQGRRHQDRRGSHGKR